MSEWSRRRFMALALGGALAPLGARSAGQDAPKRLVLLSTGHGSVYDSWHMDLGPDRKMWQAALPRHGWGPGLSPLEAVRDRLVVLDGLSLATADLDRAGYRHQKGWIHSWTGAWALMNGSAILSTAPSIDQRVAAHVARPDQLPSLELAVYNGRPISHFGRAQQLPVEADPRRAFARLFGSEGDDPVHTDRGAAMDFALREYEAVAPRLYGEDRTRIRRRLDLVHQLKLRLDGLAEPCRESDLGELPTAAGDYEAVLDAQIDLVAAAFACDRTRVVSLSLGDQLARDIGREGQSGDVHNDFAHQVFSDPGAHDAMVAYHANHAEHLRRLIEALSAIPDVDGRSVMDNTLIVWGNELADGWHGYERYQVVLAGGSWAFRGGRYLHWPYDTVPIELLGPDGPIARCGLPHQHLLVSIAQAMGLDDDHVGLDTVHTQRGDTIGLRGPLEMLW